MFGLPHRALSRESSAQQGITSDSSDSRTSRIGSKSHWTRFCLPSRTQRALSFGSERHGSTAERSTHNSRLCPELQPRPGPGLFLDRVAVGLAPWPSLARPKSSSASRFTAGASGVFKLEPIERAAGAVGQSQAGVYDLPLPTVLNKRSSMP